MTNIRRGLFVSCATFGLIATASAQPTPSDQPTTTEPATTVAPAPVVTPTYEPIGQPVHEEQQENWYKKYGVQVALGGGVAGFTNKSMRDTTRVGGDWTVRLTIGSRSMLAGEAAYIGSAQSIDALGLDTDTLLVSNGLQGNLRLNLINDMAVQPFIYGGAAWRRYTLARDNFNTSDVLGKDDVLEIPLGVGIAAKSQGFVFDARGEARVATNEDLLPSIDRTGAAAMHRWSINANVGYEF